MNKKTFPPDPLPTPKDPQPIGDHVLVTPVPEDTTVRHGTLELVVPDTAQDKPNRGIVVSVGTGRILPNGSMRAIDLNKGQKVLFSKYAGNEFRIGEQMYIILSYDDILVVLD